jgi:predicted nuclease with TOPRIM domain
MTTVPPTPPEEPTFDEFPRLVLERLDELNRNDNQLRQEVERFSDRFDELVAESKKWDERFFQLSRDTLNFSRNVIVTAAVAAVLVPIFREAIAAIVEAFKP